MFGSIVIPKRYYGEIHSRITLRRCDMARNSATGRTRNSSPVDRTCLVVKAERGDSGMCQLARPDWRAPDETSHKVTKKCMVYSRSVTRTAVLEISRRDGRDRKLLVNLPQKFNVAAHFVDRNVLEGRGSKTAIECGDERVSYQQLLERSNRAGNALRQLGVRRGERVFLLLLDTPEFLYSFFGAIKIGAVAVPVNPLLKPADYEYLLNDTEARLAVVNETLLPQLQLIPKERLRYLAEVVVVGKSNGQLSCLQDLMQAASPELDPEPTSKETSPSGSTPRGVPARPKVASTCTAIWWCARNCMPEVFWE